MDEVYMDDMTVRFTQEPDCCQNNEDWQTIEFHSENNGTGNFFWIKTDRWSFSDSEDLFRLAKRVREMEEINNRYEKNDNNKR